MRCKNGSCGRDDVRRPTSQRTNRLRSDFEKQGAGMYSSSIRNSTPNPGSDGGRIGPHARNRATHTYYPKPSLCVLLYGKESRTVNGTTDRRHHELADELQCKEGRDGELSGGEESGKDVVDV
jgi:hypothetical protein